MINTVELEKRWIRYKTRIFGSLFFILFFVAAIPYLSFYLFEQYNLIVEKDKNTSNVVIAEQLAPKIERSLPKEINDVVLSPSIPIIDFTKEKQIDREIEQKNEKIEKAKIQKLKEDKRRKAKERAYRQKVAKRRALKRERELAKKESKKRKLIKAKASSSLSVNELKVLSGDDIKKSHTREPKGNKKIDFGGSSSNYMPIMKRKFQENRNPREAILIAKAYYKAGNYIESEKWALTANNLDKENRESWLLFAESKAKLGKRKEALTILVSYHKKTKSPEVKELIDKIKGGNF